MTAGEYAIAWDGRATTRRPLARGVYYVRAEIDGARLATRIALVW